MVNWGVGVSYCGASGVWLWVELAGAGSWELGTDKP